MIPSTRTVPTAGPWTAGESRRFAGSLLAGAAALLTAWYGASGQADPADQLPFAAVGVAGLLVALGGILAGVGRGRQRLGRRLHLLVGTAPPPRLDRAEHDELVAGGDRQWFHRRDCLLAVRRDWPAASRTDHELAGRRPCPACQPEGER